VESWPDTGHACTRERRKSSISARFGPVFSLAATGGGRLWISAAVTPFAAELPTGRSQQESALCQAVATGRGGFVPCLGGVMGESTRFAANAITQPPSRQ